MSTATAVMTAVRDQLEDAIKDVQSAMKPVVVSAPPLVENLARLVDSGLAMGTVTRDETKDDYGRGKVVRVKYYPHLSGLMVLRQRLGHYIAELRE